MTTTIEAIYENGVLTLRERLDLPEKSNVLVTIQSEPAGLSNAERNAWLQQSKERLFRTWDNTADDVFNELLDR